MKLSEVAGGSLFELLERSVDGGTSCATAVQLSSTAPGPTYSPRATRSLKLSGQPSSRAYPAQHIYEVVEDVAGGKSAESP